MDRQPTSQVSTFRTPPRILIPKLVRSRDGWKQRATQFKGKLKTAQIRTRDLTTSRELWKKRAQAAEQNTHALAEQLRQTQSQLQQAQATITQLQLEEKKTPHSHRS
jgi:hypothetical protein